jgi:hypothetical protein
MPPISSSRASGSSHEAPWTKSFPFSSQTSGRSTRMRLSSCWTAAATRRKPISGCGLRSMASFCTSSICGSFRRGPMATNCNSRRPAAGLCLSSILPRLRPQYPSQRTWYGRQDSSPMGPSADAGGALMRPFQNVVRHTESMASASHPTAVADLHWRHQ